MAATIKDIARTLKISTSTVSYALNGGPRNVPDDVRQRVIETARSLGYRPNRIARTMVTRRTNTYGVIPTEASINLAVSPYFQLVLNGIMNAAEQRHHDVLIFTGYDQKNVEAFADTILDGRVDGLIFLSPPNPNPLYEMVQAAGIPYVVTSGHAPTSPCLIVDNDQGVRLALEHLYELGHRSVGMVYGKLWMEDGQRRLEAFRSSTASLGMKTCREWEFDGDFTQDGGRLAFPWFKQLVERPTALFCANDEIAAGFVWEANANGMEIPREVSIVGFDNSVISANTSPSITTIEQPLVEIGYSAVEKIVEIVAGRTVESETFSTRLIVRASTSSPQEDKK